MVKQFTIQQRTMTSKHIINDQVVSTMTEKSQNALGLREGAPNEVGGDIRRFSEGSDIRKEIWVSYPGEVAGGHPQKAVEKGVGRGVARVFQAQRQAQTKVWRWGRVWCIWRKERKQLLLKGRDGGKENGKEVRDGAGEMKVMKMRMMMMMVTDDDGGGDSWHVCTYSVAGTVLSISYTLIPLTLTTALWSKNTQQCSFYRRGHWGTDRLNNLSKVPLLTYGKARNQTQTIWFKSLDILLPLKDLAVKGMVSHFSEFEVYLDSNREQFLRLEWRNIILPSPCTPGVFTARENAGNMPEACVIASLALLGASQVELISLEMLLRRQHHCSWILKFSIPDHVICLLWKQCHEMNTGFRLRKVKIQILVPALTNSSMTLTPLSLSFLMCNIRD